MSYTSTPPAEIVESDYHSLLKLPRNTAPASQYTPGFLDGKYHEELSDKLDCHYSMPSRGVPCEPEAMHLWLKRLGITVTEYLQATQLRSLADFCTLNPAWSLRAWLGTILEMRHERSGAQ